jgi:hypothetical protein
MQVSADSDWGRFGGRTFILGIKSAYQSCNRVCNWVARPLFRVRSGPFKQPKYVGEGLEAVRGVPSQFCTFCEHASNSLFEYAENPDFGNRKGGRVANRPPHLTTILLIRCWPGAQAGGRWAALLTTTVC